MANFEIELNIVNQGSSIFTVNPTLSGQVYQFRLKWTIRPGGGTGAWILDIDETIFGIKLVSGIDVLDPYRYIDALPPGKLGVFRNSGRGSKPGYDNFGINKEYTLIYEEP